MQVEILQQLHPKFAKVHAQLVHQLRRQHTRPVLDEAQIASIQDAERRRELRKAKRRQR